MAQDAELPKAADKGKGKAVDDPKNENAAVNGKKEDDKKDGTCPCNQEWLAATLLT